MRRRSHVLAFSVLLLGACVAAPSEVPSASELVRSPKDVVALFRVPAEEWVREPSSVAETDWHVTVEWRGDGLLLVERIGIAESDGVASAAFGYGLSGLPRAHGGLPVIPSALDAYLPIIAHMDDEVVGCGEGDPDNLCQHWYYEGRLGRVLFSVTLFSVDGQPLSVFAEGVRTLDPLAEMVDGER